MPVEFPFSSRQHNHSGKLHNISSTNKSDNIKKKEHGKIAHVGEQLVIYSSLQGGARIQSVHVSDVEANYFWCNKNLVFGLILTFVESNVLHTTKILIN